MQETLQPFEAEVGRVLDIVVNSLYRHREIFLRELISNASDACDKLRYLSLSEPELLGDRPELVIDIVIDRGRRLLTVRDNGIGMNRDELVANLGTIARSGTARFLQELTGDRKHDLELIGQFGVGFYSAFMVSDRVVVLSRRAGEDRGWVWVSDGRTGFAVEEADELPPRGTSVTLHLKQDADEFLDPWRIRQIVRTYSDHIAFPIFLEVIPAPGDTKTNLHQRQQINTGSALWTRPKNTITEEQYREFYHHVAHAFDDPFIHIHFTAEGTLSWTALLFVPSARPFDLFDPRRRHGVKLYVRRVFITDELDTLLPRYLRFVSGVVDSDDLPLNVSRESLQHNAVVARMKKTLTRRVLDELARKAAAAGTATTGAGEEAETRQESSGKSWDEWWEDFGPVLKEGLYEDEDNRERILSLARFRTTGPEEWVSLDTYLARMKPGQKAIYYIGGDDPKALRTHPQLEQALAKGIEVLLMTDPVDQFWLPVVERCRDTPFVSLTRGEIDLSAIAGEPSAAEEAPPIDDAALTRLIARLKAALGDAVRDVRPSKRLKESPVCLVADAAAMDLRLERFLLQHSQIRELSPRVLEINPRHELIRRMADLAARQGEVPEFDELARLLLDQARIVEGEPLPDPGAFLRSMGRFLARALETSMRPTAG